MKKYNKKGAKKNKSIINYVYLGVDFHEDVKIYLLQEIIKKYIYDLINNFPEESSFNELPFYFEDEKNDNIAFIQNNKDTNKNNIQKWKNPNSIHITTLFMGKNFYNKNSKILSNFKENEEVEVDILGIIIIPYKIAICIVKINIESDNKFPHITLSVGTYKPKNSNDVLEILFGNNGKYKEYYYKIIDDEEVNLIKKDKINIFESEEDIYIKLKNEKISIKGFQKGFHF